MKQTLSILVALGLLASCAQSAGAQSVGAARGEIRTFIPATIGEAFPDANVRSLVEAACRGDAARVAALTRSGVDPNAPGMMLIGPGDILGRHPEDPLRAPVRPLSWMLVCRSPAGVEALVAAGADPERRLYNHVSLIEVAIWVDDLRMLEALLDAGADPNSCGRGCPFAAAIDVWRQNGSWRSLDLLAARGLDVDRMASELREDRFRNTTLSEIIAERAACKALSFAQAGARRNEAMLIYINRSRLRNAGLYARGQHQCALELDRLLTERVGENAYQAWLVDFTEAREAWSRR